MKNDIRIILGLNLLFFSVWVVTLFFSVSHPALSDAATKLYGVFVGVNNALMLVLNAGAKPSTNPTLPDSPAQPSK